MKSQRRASNAFMRSASIPEALIIFATSVCALGWGVGLTPALIAMSQRLKLILAIFLHVPALR